MGRHRPRLHDPTADQGRRPRFRPRELARGDAVLRLVHDDVGWTDVPDPERGGGSSGRSPVPEAIAGVLIGRPTLRLTDMFAGLAAVLCVMTVYAINFVGARYSVLHGLRSLDLAALRYSISGLIMLPSFL